MEVQRLFGENLEKPNYPEVKIRQLGKTGKYAVIWGGELLLYNHRGSRVCTIKKLTESCLAFLDTTPDLIVTGDNDKQLIVLQLKGEGDDVEIKSTYVMRRRIADAKVIANGSRLVTADKFGDIHIRDWEEVAQVSAKMYKLILRHMCQYPNDETFYRINKKYIEQMKAQNIFIPTELDSSKPKKGPMANPLDEESDEEDDPFADRCLANHLATITKLYLMHLESPKGEMDLLVTCDKDEKMRVSQCPEVHIVERIYCGHSNFITDATNVGSTIYTLSADKTLKKWDLAITDSETNTWKLNTIPLKFIAGSPPPGKLSFIHCASKVITSLDLDSGNLSETELTDIVVEACFAEDGSLLWVDPHGQLHSSKDNDDSILGSFTAGEVPLIHRHWKHTQEDTAPTLEERLAKRRRHKTNTVKEGLSPPSVS